MNDLPKKNPTRGVYRIESEVFHFEKPQPNGLSDFLKPHAAVDHPVGGPSLARQEFAEECDINEIMKRYEATGVLPAVSGEPFYADFSSVPMDMQSAMEQMRDAQEAFMTLPAKVRREFDNDAAVFVDYASDPANLDQMREWGLAPPKPAPAAAQAAPGASGAPAPAPAPQPPAAPQGAAGGPTQ